MWKINRIKIYTENFDKNKILDFSESDRQTFSIVKNNDLSKILKKNLSRNKLVKFQKDKDLKEIKKKL